MLDNTLTELTDYIRQSFNTVFSTRIWSTDAGYIITLGDLLHFFLATLLVIFLARGIRNLLIHRLFKNSPAIHPYRHTIGNVVRYLILIFGFMIVINSIGINLSSLYVIFGSLGVGIGIGLQNLTENFISGLLIMFERPVKVGDRIEVDDVNGIITQIGARATSVITNDNISIILPNSYLTNQAVTNWSHNNFRIRLRFPVGVSYNEDPEKVREILLSVVDEHKGIMKNPAPQVLFVNFGDSSLDFSLDVWTESYLHKFDILKSEIYYNIFREFKANNIEIPFPQRDLHIRSGLHLTEKAMTPQE
ncbi:mechanosensitive ion channel family protein [Persicobacter psychrovividus]|uniref:Mechanosensitive ion channel protein MscS n=1 Tax=Persicobacter psychrovividus TaxID=387638 RepID=A0ABN6L7H2_9BACT|nr:mechanosensitive ion channel protein MscS [Persicobacter psychrovividus]